MTSPAPTPVPSTMTMFVEWLDRDTAHLALVNRYTGDGPAMVNVGNQLEIWVAGRASFVPVTRAECLALAAAFLNAALAPDWPPEGP